MSSSKEYVEYVLEQLSDAGEVSSRAMMGEYVVYFRDKVIGGIYDDRFLVKPTPAAVSLLAGYVSRASGTQAPQEKVAAARWQNGRGAKALARRAHATVQLAFGACGKHRLAAQRSYLWRSRG